MNIQRMFSKLAVFIALTLSSSSVFATGATVSFTNAAAVNPTAVPTLSGWMLIVLSLLLFAVAFKISRQKGNNTGKFFLVLMGIGMLTSGSGGIKLISDVQAGTVSLPVTYVPSNKTYFIDPSIDGYTYGLYTNDSAGGGPLDFSIVADGAPSPTSYCLYEIRIDDPHVSDGSESALAGEHNGVLPYGQSLYVRCQTLAPT